MKGLFSHKLLSGLIFILLAVFAFIPMTDEAKAASKATVTISSGEVTKGKEIEVTIKVDAETNIGAYDFYVTYDPNILEAVSGYEDGGNGQLQLMGYISDTSDLSSSKTFKIKFKALAVGSSKIEYLCLTSDKGIIDYDTVENMEVTASAGTVNVKAPYIASSNKDLASLKVAAVRADGSSYTLTLSPKFSNSVTKYSLTTEEGVTKLVVTAKAEDDKATVKVSGATLKGGTNTTTITVTAEDGSTRKYTITTTVPVPPTTTAPPPEPVIVIMDGKECHIKDISETTNVPEGFEAVEYDYKDEKVMVAKGLSKKLIVMYITDSEGANGGLYIYDEGKDIFYPMSNIQVTDKLYTIVKYPEDLIVPEGYVQGEITVGDVTFNGWTNTELDKVYLVYAMNWNGEEGLYFYDTAEGQMIKYFELSVEAGVGLDEYNQLVVENEKLKDEINQLKKDNNNEVEKKTSLYKYISIICAVMAAIYLGVIIILLVKRRGKNEDTEAYEDTEESNQSEAIDEATDSVDDTENSEADVDTENIDNAMEAALASEVAAAMMDGVELAETPSEVIDPETVEESEVVVEPVIEAELETAEEIEAAEEPETEVEVEATEELEAEPEIEAVEESEIQPETIDESESEIDQQINEEFASELQPDIDVASMEDAIMASVAMAASEELAEEPEVVVSEPEADEATEAEIEAEAEEATEEEAEEEIDEAIEEEAETEVEETAEDIVETDEVATIVEEAIDEEEVEPISDVDEKKKKVQDIMNDDSTSIHADDLDLVIDELFDDLFGE